MMAGMDQLAAANKALLDTTRTVNLKALEGVEKLVALQMQAARTAMDETVEHAKNLMAIDEPARLAEQNMAFVQPAGEKLAAYAKHVYDITVETNTAVAELLQKQAEQAQGQYAEWLDAAMKGVPAGSEPMVAAARNAMSVAQGAYEQAMSASRKFAEVAEQNMAGVAKGGAAKGVKKAA